jgi:beta-N-acetylhexosaminidase
MGFSGLILTDDLHMGALRALGTLGESATVAAEAGHDILLLCGETKDALEVFEALKAAYQTGRLNQAELEETAHRLAMARKKVSS